MGSGGMEAEYVCHKLVRLVCVPHPRTSGRVPSGGKVELTFDSLDLDFVEVSPTVTFQSPSGATVDSVGWDAGTNTLTIVMGDEIAQNMTVVYTIADTVMPEATRPTSFGTIATFDESNIAIDRLSNVAVVGIVPGVVTVLEDVDFSANTPGIDTSFTLLFVVSGAIPPGGQIRLQFMNFIPTTNTTEADIDVEFGLPNSAGGSVVCDLDGVKECVVTLDDSTSIAASETVQITFTGVTTPSSTQSPSFALLTTYASSSRLDLIDGPANVTVESFAPGSLGPKSIIHFDTSNPGRSTSIVVAFQTTGQILDEGFVQIDFAPTYGVDLASNSPVVDFLAPVSAVVGDVAWHVNGLTVQIDGSISQNESVEILITNVITPPSARGTSFVNITTYDSSSGRIDGPSLFQVSPILPGSIVPSVDGIHLDVATPGVMGDIMVSFSLSAATVSAHSTILEIKFPADIEFGMSVSPTVTFLDPLGIAGDANYIEPVLRITLDENSAFVQSENVSIVIHDVRTPSSIRSASEAALTIFESLPTGEKIVDGPINVGIQRFVHGNISTDAAFFLRSTPSVTDRLKLAFHTTGEVVAGGHIVVSFVGQRFSWPGSDKSSVHVWTGAGTVASGDGLWSGGNLDVEVLEAVPQNQSVHMLVGNLTTPLTITPAGVQTLTIATLDDEIMLIDESRGMGIDEIYPSEIEDCLFSTQFHAQSGMVAGMLGDATLRFRVRGSILPYGSIVLLLEDKEWQVEDVSFACRMEVDGASVPDCSGEWVVSDVGVVVTLSVGAAVTIPTNSSLVVTVPGVKTPSSIRPTSEAFIFTTNLHDDVTFGISPANIKTSCPHLCGNDTAIDDVDACAPYQAFSAVVVRYFCEWGDPYFFGLVDGISSCTVPDIPRGLNQLGSSGDSTLVVVEQVKTFDFTGALFGE